MNLKQRRYIRLLYFIISITAIAIDISIPLLPIITEYFAVSSNQAPLIISSFLAGYGMSMIPIGLLSDRYGRLPLLYVGLLIYILSGVLISFAPDFKTLLWARFFQGVGGGVGPINARAIARDMKSGNDLTKLLSNITAALFLAPIIAPVLGGYLCQHLGWRLAMLVVPLLGVILLIITFLTSYETLNIKELQNSSILSHVKSSLNLFFNSSKSIWALLIIFLSFPAYQILLANASLIMTEIYSIDTDKVGLIFGASCISMVCASIYNSAQSNSKSPIELLEYGMILSGISALGLLAYSYLECSSFGILWGVFMIQITAMGFILPNTAAIALEPLAKIAGFASSIFGAVMILGASVATTVVSKYYNGTLGSVIHSIVSCLVISLMIYYIGRRSYEKS